ncbi:unnamed protein product [Phytophthora fragariaefolia]|uniref:Unnamed protein product n=1 Tax=Phytophthora fragariaefolia TaxID=1490495 RepID=A0A9W7CMZ8_9STRA|nr:unnamed protein product [Phytophthora fragariaefolia]
MAVPISLSEDQGSRSGIRFTGDEFQALLLSTPIKDKPITAKNTPVNVIYERVHMEIMNLLRARPDLNDQLEVVVDYAAYAIRASYHTVLRASPAQLLYGCGAADSNPRTQENRSRLKGSIQHQAFDNGNVLLDTESTEYPTNIGLPPATGSCSAKKRASLVTALWSTVTLPLQLKEEKSSNGYAIFYNGNLVDWGSKEQTMVTLSSPEREFVAKTAAVHECIGLLMVLKDIGTSVGPIVVMEDNQGARYLAEGKGRGPTIALHRYEVSLAQVEGR